MRSICRADVDAIRIPKRRSARLGQSMDDSGTTCWEMLDAAVAGSREARARFAQRYEPLARAYFSARWRSPPLLFEIDDAVQEVFVECLKSGGILQKAQPDRPGGFRAFLYGLIRNVARRFESRRGATSCTELEPDELPADEETFSRVFDRAWAKSVMRDAAAKQAISAQLAGPEAVRRLELLRLRFQEDLPIREIAQRWEVDAAHLHREYAKAREEFRAALREVLSSFHGVGGAALERECTELLSLLA
jgi:RNA polymerase sigma factor (sigma-70 family)